MDIKDGSPRFIYNLNYENGAQVITLEEGSSLYQKEMNIRIGMVGGVAGLAIQEWKKSKVCICCEHSESSQNVQAQRTQDLTLGGLPYAT